MANKYNFHPNGVTLKLPSGDIILNAGNNMTIFPQGDLVTFTPQIPENVLVNNVTAWQPPAMADANAPLNSVYFSKTNGKLSYRDSGGTVHALY